MRKCTALITMLLSSLIFAQDISPYQIPVLDKINFQLSAKGWVETKSALILVTVNATLNNADLIKTRSDIMNRLSKIANGEWHITEFNRSQDSSGLDKLDVLAQARVSQSQLTDIYQNAKSVSIPGAKYQINGVEFKPTLEETQFVLNKVREQLYKNTLDEIGRLNKIYPNQNYSIQRIQFLQEGSDISTKSMRTFSAAAVANAPIAVSNELILTADVELASNRKL